MLGFPARPVTCGRAGGPFHLHGMTFNLEILALANELGSDVDGWALLAPYGHHRKTRTVERDGQVTEETFDQVFDEASVAEVLANDAVGGTVSIAKRFPIKRPIYNGHPDINLYAPETVTAAAETMMPLGVNDQCRRTMRGLEFRPLLTEAGANVVEAGCKFPSGLFLLKRTGKVLEDGAIEVRPFKLASIGLTSSPNIYGVDSLANARTGMPAGSAAAVMAGAIGELVRAGRTRSQALDQVMRARPGLYRIYRTEGGPL